MTTPNLRRMKSLRSSQNRVLKSPSSAARGPFPGSFIRLMVLILWAGILISGCKKEKESPEPEKLDYRYQWLGEYEGTAYTFYEYPINMEYYTEWDTLRVTIQMVKAEIDSTVNLYLAYENNQKDTIVNLTISGEGKIYRGNRGGSSAYSLDVTLTGTHLDFYLYRKFGMPVTHTTTIEAERKMKGGGRDEL